MLGSSAARRAVEAAQQPLAAAVGHLDERDAVGPAHVGWSHQIEVGGELDLALRVDRRLIEVDDDAVARVFRIDREMRRAEDLLVPDAPIAAWPAMSTPVTSAPAGAAMAAKAPKARIR